MGATIELLRRERRARLFFAAHAQSSLGNGAAYVALLILAYDRMSSPWAISLVLLADFLPAMLLGPLFGAAADRWSRRWCAVVSDVARAGAFIAIGLVGSFELTVAFALVAGAGSGLFTPAVMAGLPSLVEKRRLPAATALYGAITDVGHTLGPAFAAVMLLATGAETLMVVNGATFAVSALVLALLPFGARPADQPDEARLSLIAETRAGMRAAAHMRGVRAVIIGTSSILFFAGLFNVGELLLAEGPLGTGDSGFSALVAVFGLGFIVGSLSGSKVTAVARQKRNYLIGLLTLAIGFAATGLAPAYEVALVTFAISGFGNGLVLVHERLLLQYTVPDALMGRVFGVRDGLGAWGFGIAFISAGAILSVIDTRVLFLIGGAGALVVWAASAYALRDAWLDEDHVEPAADLAPALARGDLGAGPSPATSGVVASSGSTGDAPEAVDSRPSDRERQ